MAASRTRAWGANPRASGGGRAPPLAWRTMSWPARPRARQRAYSSSRNPIRSGRYLPFAGAPHPRTNTSLFLQRFATMGLNRWRAASIYSAYSPHPCPGADLRASRSQDALAASLICRLGKPLAPTLCPKHVIGIASQLYDRACFRGAKVYGRTSRWISIRLRAP